MSTRPRLLAAAALLALFAASPAAAASPEAPASLEARIQQRDRTLEEQHRPRVAVPFDPGSFDKYAGIYQRAPSEFFVVSRQGDRVFLDVTVPGPEKPRTLEFSPESPAKFFSKTPPIQISFPASQGKAAKLVLHASGFEFELPRVDETVVARAMAAVEARVKARTPEPGSQAKLRRFLEGFQRGAPNYAEIGPEAAVEYATEFHQKYMDQAKALGAIKSLTFIEVTPRDEDKYAVVGEHGRADVTIDFRADGKIDTVMIGPLQN